MEVTPPPVRQDLSMFAFFSFFFFFLIGDLLNPLTKRPCDSVCGESKPVCFVFQAGVGKALPEVLSQIKSVYDCRKVLKIGPINF